MKKMGYCGDVCNYCPRYIATQSGDNEKLRDVAILWHKAGARPRVLPPEEMACTGCFPHKECEFGIAQCASAKGLANCGECPEFPCIVLKSRFDMIPALSKKWRKVCTKQEFDLIRKAFWEKKENLERARAEWLDRE